MNAVMTQEEKQLLQKDLCARLPYGVKLDFFSKATNEHIVCNLIGIEPEGDKPIIAKVDCGAFLFPQEHVKPYLRPMSSMTEEEDKQWMHLRTEVEKYTIGYDAVVDFYNEHHFDYRGLIDMELALEAPKGMYKTT